MTAHRFYSDREPNTLDPLSRTAKAQKILAVLSDYCSGRSMDNWYCLDTGCSGGIMDCYLGSHFGSVIGVDVDEQAILFAESHCSQPNVQFVLGSACDSLFRQSSFDVVICNHIYEHVPSANLLFGEIYRALKPGGICYLACTNKYCFIEPHYHLPLLSWLPRPLANYYLRLLRKGKAYDENLLSRSDILNLLGSFDVVDYTLTIFSSPERFAASDVVKEYRWSAHIPMSLARLLLFWMPTFIWVLRKPVQDEI